MNKSNLDIVINQLSKTDARWFAVYTKYKCEKYVAAQLKKKQIETYVPIITKTKRYNRKIKHYEIPLINCYVFVCITKEQYIPILQTEYVMKFLTQGRDLLAIPNHEIEILQRVTGLVEEAVLNDKQDFENGDEVEVISGQLTGLKGKILAKAGKKSFIVELDSIGYQLRINIDLKLLRPIHKKVLIY
jgi:transcription antitermination factor NusG